MKTALRNVWSTCVTYLISWKILKREKQLDYSAYELSFSDDFNGKRLDTNKWMTHYYWGHAHSDYEHQFYASDAFSIKDSTLTINVEDRKVKGWYVKDGKRASKTFDVTSGLIHTGESFKQRYGRFQIRCKVPLEKGYMPSFWLINPNSYPPEIDVMDFSEGDNKILSVGYSYGDNEIESLFHVVKKFIKKLTIGCDWNVYTLDWTPTTLTWYVNGHQVFRSANKGIPQTPMYVAINMAIGDIQNTKSLSTKKMQIDWVKVYKLSN